MKRPLRWLGLSSAIVMALLCGALYIWPQKPFAAGFVDKFSGNCFSGFLTLGGFLLAMKNLIVLRIQEKIYDTKSYKALFEANRKGEEGLYDPLVNLTELMVGSVGSCLASAIVMLVAGAVKDELASCIAISVAAGTLSLVFKCWWEMRGNFMDYFSRLEADYTKSIREKERAAAEERDKDKV